MVNKLIDYGKTLLTGKFIPAVKTTRFLNPRGIRSKGIMNYATALIADRFGEQSLKDYFSWLVTINSHHSDVMVIKWCIEFKPENSYELNDSDYEEFGLFCFCHDVGKPHSSWLEERINKRTVEKYIEFSLREPYERMCFIENVKPLLPWYINTQYGENTRECIQYGDRGHKCHTVKWTRDY